MFRLLSRALLAGLLLAMLCPGNSFVSAQTAPADPVLYWNEVTLQAIAADHSETFGLPEQLGPGRSARALAIVHVAIYDVVNSIRPTHEPYYILIPVTEPTSLEAAVTEAAYQSLLYLYPAKKTTFDEARQAYLAFSADSEEKTRGLALGETIAAKIIASRRHDGSAEPEEYTPSDQPGKHRPDPMNPGQLKGLNPQWGNIVPFALLSGAQFRAPPPPAMESGEYAGAFFEVKAMGGDGINTPMGRIHDQTEMALFWAYDGVKNLGTPPRLYNQIARAIATQRSNTIEQNARLFALINIALADAGIGSWESKYFYNFWRPVVAIREADAGTGPTGLGDGNSQTVGDPSWIPMGSPASNESGNDFTPPFPAYPSGHATFGAAAFSAIANFYGTDEIPFTFTSEELNGVTKDSKGNVRPLSPRSFQRLSEAIYENAISRIYLGIHWNFDATAGMEMGDKIADYTTERLLLPTTRFQPSSSSQSSISQSSFGEDSSSSSMQSSVRSSSRSSRSSKKSRHYTYLQPAERRPVRHHPYLVASTRPLPVLENHMSYPRADSLLSIEKSADRAETQPGGIVSYSITIRNTGHEPLREVRVEEQFPANFLSVEQEGAGDVSTGIIRWELETIAPQSERILRYTARVSRQALHGEIIQTVATAMVNDAAVQDSHVLRVITQLPQTGQRAFGGGGDNGLISKKASSSGSGALPGFLLTVSLCYTGFAARRRFFV